MFKGIIPMNIGKRIRILREKKGIQQLELANKIKISQSKMNKIETGYQKKIEPELISEIAKSLNVTTDYLLGNTETNKLPQLTSKDERDIAKDLENIINNLENPDDSYAAFDGQTLDDLDEEDRELLIHALEQSMKIAKRIAKKKYTPKKYRNEE